MLTAFTIVLGLMAITLHELGHYEAMRRCGVSVKEVALLGVPLKFLPSFRYQRGETTWSVHPLIVGAYVEPRHPEFMELLPLWDRLYIYGNGVTVNIIYALLLLFGSAAISLIEQDNLVKALMVTAAAIGLSWILWRTRRFLCIALVVLSVPLLCAITYLLVGVSFKESLDAGDGGPVAIVRLLTQADEVSQGLKLAALVSISLATMNILPLPALDGGHMVGAVVRKYLGKRAWMIFTLAGTPFLLYLIVTSLALDAARIWRWIW